mmetsp:Transcript_6903/g.15154  ORF Transcript_6903/g.15154 Transcript_6903/m.15154 type:complete len:222 (+) Transcript_6903:1279-1944(+)
MVLSDAHQHRLKCACQHAGLESPAGDVKGLCNVLEAYLLHYEGYVVVHLHLEGGGQQLEGRAQHHLVHRGGRVSRLTGQRRIGVGRGNHVWLQMPAPLILGLFLLLPLLLHLHLSLPLRLHLCLSLLLLLPLRLRLLRSYLHPQHAQDRHVCGCDVAHYAHHRLLEGQPGGGLVHEDGGVYAAQHLQHVDADQMHILLIQRAGRSAGVRAGVRAGIRAGVN